MPSFEYGEEQMSASVTASVLLFRKRFLAAIRQMRNGVAIEQLALLIRQGRMNEALAQAEAAALNLSNAYATSYTTSANKVTGFISTKANVIVSFDQINDRAVLEMREAGLRLVREFTTKQRAATRRALTMGVRLGLNPRDQAMLLRQSIGLTVTQVEAVANYRRLLEQGSRRALDRALRDRRYDAATARAAAGGKALSEGQIDRMVERYYQRSLVNRAETIARTEALGATHQGADAGFRAAIDQGAIGDELSQVWHTAGDARVRIPSHTFMNGQVRPFGQPFVSGTGNLLRWPGDQRAPAHDVVQCRCVKTTRFTIDIA